MRNTWIRDIKQDESYKNKVKTVFVLAAESSEGEALKQMISEWNLHKDILLIDLKDNLFMHAQKVLGFMEYFTQNCEQEEITKSLSGPKVQSKQKFPLLAKVTDDVIIFPDNLIKVLQSISNSQETFFSGGIYIFAGHFASGSGYILSYQAVKEIFEFARCLNAVMYQDDVVFTGDLRERLGIAKMHFNFRDNCDHWTSVEFNSQTILKKSTLIHKTPGFSTQQQIEIYQVGMGKKNTNA